MEIVHLTIFLGENMTFWNILSRCLWSLEVDYAVGLV